MALAPTQSLVETPSRAFYRQAMETYGSDKPDLRFRMELFDASDIFATSEFMVFKSTLQNGGVIKCIEVPGCAGYTRKEVDDLTQFARETGAKGLATLALTAEGVKGTAQKFIKPEEVATLQACTGASEGDLVLFAAVGAGARPESVLGKRCAAVGAVRMELIGHENNYSGCP